MNHLHLILKELLFYSAVILLQWLFVPLISVNRSTPDLLLISLLLHSLHLEKPGPAVLTALLAGAAFDWLTGSITGLSPLYLILAAFAGAITGREIEKLTKTSLLILGLSVLPACLAIHSFIRLAGLPGLTIALNHFLPGLIYTLALYLIYINLFSFKKKRKSA